MTSSAPPALPNADDRRLLDRLRAAVRGEVLCDETSLGLYATDASIFQIRPRAVVVPLDRADALAAIRVAAECGAAIVPRGGGTSLSGQTINRAVVIDASKRLNRVIEVNAKERLVRVEPGVVRNNLNELLKPLGLHFAPDPATSSRANVGGMIGNNAAGTRSILYGMTIDHLLSVDLALSTGEVMHIEPLNREEWLAKERRDDREGAIYRGFRRIIEENRSEILARFPKVLRRSGGYMLDAFPTPFEGDTTWNLAKIVAASEGTLGVVVEAKLNLEPLPRHRFLCTAFFDSTEKMLRAVAPIVSHKVSAVELTDGLIVDLARKSHTTRNKCYFLEGDVAGGFLAIEAQGEDADEVAARLRAISAELLASGAAYAAPVFTDAKTIADVWLMRESAQGLLVTVKGDRKPTPFIEDSAVPLDVFPEFILKVREICERHGRKIGLFAHASVGLLHIRPLLDMHNPEEVGISTRIQDEVFAEVVRLGGSFSGEHGDGLVRGAYVEAFFGPKLYAAFGELKNLFDPLGLMNPGHKISVPPVSENRGALRYGPGYAMKPVETWFHYRADGGLRQAVEQCTGTAACRQTQKGLMCPSYLATRDEEHSTRGRANALRLCMTGQMGKSGLADESLKRVMDLCLSCKGCEGECPNGVDMAKLKAETLQHYHEAHGSTLRDKLFRDNAKTAPLASGILAPVVNATMNFSPLRVAMEHLVGIDRRRKMPQYARVTLTKWFDKRSSPVTPGGVRRVALFCDTYIEHFQSEVGRAAVEVLEAAGFRVELAVAGCCQRPAISKGFLDVAKRKGTKTMQNLDKWAKEGVPILVCEPSCASSLADDLPDIIDDEALGKRVAACVRPLDQFLGEELAAGRIAFPWAAPKPQTILYHGHCHHKAIFKVDPVLALLQAIPGADVRMIDAGCCGMAGAFGYEREHYEMSVKIARDKLIPAIEAAPKDARIVAAGFSCRHQIKDLSDRQTMHPIQVVREALGT